MTTAELQKALGVSRRTVARYAKRGCPHRKDRTGLVFDLPQVLAWIEREGLPSVQRQDREHKAGRPSHADALPSEGAQSKQHLAKAELARRISVAKTAEMVAQAERGLQDLDLSDSIRKAKTYDDLAQLNQEVGALVANGRLIPQRGQAIQRLLAEARQNLKEKARSQEQDAGDSDIVLASVDAVEIARLFEGVVSDERRAHLLEVVRAAAVEDERENPNTDPGEGSTE